MPPPLRKRHGIATRTLGSLSAPLQRHVRGNRDKRQRRMPNHLQTFATEGGHVILAASRAQTYRSCHFGMFLTCLIMLHHCWTCVTVTQNSTVY